MKAKIKMVKMMTTTTTKEDGDVVATKTTTSPIVRVTATGPDNRGPVASNKIKLLDRLMTSLSSSTEVARDIRRAFNLLSLN